MVSRRGQAYTLEALVASLLLLGAVVFALQATAVTPQSDSTASGHSRAQLERAGEGVVEAAAANGSLRRTALYWNTSTGTFHGLAPYESAYANRDLPTAFGRRLARSVGPDAVAYNVAVVYRTAGGAVKTETIVDSGTPSDGAVAVRETVTVYDDDRLTAQDGDPGNRTVAATAFYLPDAAPNSGVYNVVTVEVVLWPT